MDIRQIQAMANDNQPEKQVKVPTTDTEKNQVDLIKEQLKEETKTEQPALVKRDEDISFTYTYQDGSTKAHAIVSHVLDGVGRSKMARIQVALANGFDFESLPVEEKGRISCIARVASQVKDCPDWLLELVSEDLDLCFELAQQLARHEMRYFRGIDSEGKVKENGKRFSFGKAIS